MLVNTLLLFIYLFKCILSYFYLTFYRLMLIFYRNFKVGNFYYDYTVQRNEQGCCWHGAIEK